MLQGTAVVALMAVGGFACHSILTSPATAPARSAARPASALAAKGLMATGPAPLLQTGQAVDWWFVFKFNNGTLPDCGGAERSCIFGGKPQPYGKFGQQFAYASSLDHTVQSGTGCVGDTETDPVGATFAQIYNGTYFYVLWNDQFYGNPINTKSAPAGHSKGMLAWDANGNGFVMQVSTPSWPASGSARNPRRKDGNTLGCVQDNDVFVSQHFFALKLDKPDIFAVLSALKNASAVTNPARPELVHNGGPAGIQALVQKLGKNSASKTWTKTTLSTGVVLISKPSNLNVPPWQMVSSVLGGEPLRVASWWTIPEIPTTTASDSVGCWDPSLAKPGPVEIAKSGTWLGRPIGLEGMDAPEGNHAKIGVSTGTHSYAIFGDMNQQGSLSGPNCNSSQNGRGGLFYVVEDAALAKSVRSLITPP
jgi:hypothetical protein